MTFGLHEVNEATFWATTEEGEVQEAFPPTREDTEGEATEPGKTATEAAQPVTQEAMGIRTEPPDDNEGALGEGSATKATEAEPSVTQVEQGIELA